MNPTDLDYLKSDLMNQAFDGLDKLETEEKLETYEGLDD